jgi:2-polyprenyl-6-methoxyphenol hydroxylase-like FAD-dependent oxidoreductase
MVPSALPSRPAVLIVGAGPVGLTLAVQLARFGVPFRIVERSAGPSTATKAMAVHSRTLEIFRELGVASQAVDAGKKIRRFRAQSNGRTILLYDFELLDAAYPFLLGLPQPRTERLLLERLVALGGRVEWGVAVEGLAQGDDGVGVTLRRAGEQEERVATRWLAGCDGARSTVRRALGVEFGGGSYHRHFMLADVDVEWDGGRDEGAFFLGSRDGYVAVAPLDDYGRYRLFVEIPHDLPPEDERPALDLTTFQRLCDGRGQAMRLANESSATAAAFQHRRVRRQRVGNVFLLGDAAHIGSPIGGQYMNMGIAEAHNLAWKLAHVHAGAAGAELLDSYDAERAPVAAEAERTAHVLTRILTIRSRVLIGLRDALFPVIGGIGGVRRALPWMISGHRYRYGASPVIEDARDGGRGARPRRAWGVTRRAARGPAAGALAPDLELWRMRGDPARRLLDLWQGRFVLLLFGGRDDGAPLVRARARLAAELRRHYPCVDARLVLDTLDTHDVAPGAPVLPDPDFRIHRRYGAAGGEIVLVRPDGHVGFTGASEDALRRYLERSSALRPTAATAPAARRAS